LISQTELGSKFFYLRAFDKKELKVAKMINFLEL